MPERRTTDGPRRQLRRLVVVTIAAVTLAVATAQGVTQATALSYRDPLLADLREAVTEAEAARRVPSGFGYSVSVRPSVSTSNTLEGDDDPTVTTSLGASATGSYRYSAVRPIRAERDLARAQHDLFNAERDGVLRALRAHVTWWTQARSMTSADERLERARDALATGALDFAAGDIDHARLQALQLDYDRAELQHREVSHRHAIAVAGAADVGLSGTPAYEPLRFALPAPVIDDLYAVRTRLSTLEEADANRVMGSLLSLPKELRLTGSWNAEDVRFSASAGVFNRVPGADLSVTYPGVTTPSWSIGVSAEFVFTNSTLSSLEQAEARVDTARDALTAFLSTYPDDVANARLQTEFAEESLHLAERALDLEERRVDTLEAELASANERLGSADADQAASIEREIAGLERDLNGARTALDRAEGALLSAWNGYVTQVHAYLRLVEGVWALR